MDERAGDRDSLLLAARQLIGELALFAFEADDAEHLLHFRLEVTQGAFGHAQGEGNVLKHGQVGEELEILKDHANLATQVR